MKKTMTTNLKKKTKMMTTLMMKRTAMTTTLMMKGKMESKSDHVLGSKTKMGIGMVKLSNSTMMPIPLLSSAKMMAMNMKSNGMRFSKMIERC